VYDADPNKVGSARRYARLSYQQVIDQGLGVMDQSAFILARDHRLPLHVFDVDQQGAAASISAGDHIAP
jgi:uridylate kinase